MTPLSCEAVNYLLPFPKETIQQPLAIQSRSVRSGATSFAGHTHPIKPTRTLATEIGNAFHEDSYPVGQRATSEIKTEFRKLLDSQCAGHDAWMQFYFYAYYQSARLFVTWPQDFRVCLRKFASISNKAQDENVLSSISGWDPGHFSQNVSSPFQL